MSDTQRFYGTDTEPCITEEEDYVGRYHGAGVPVQEHPKGRQILHWRGDVVKLTCGHCNSAKVLVVTAKWSIHPMQGDFYCDVEYVCQDCQHFTAVSASTY